MHGSLDDALRTFPCARLPHFKSQEHDTQSTITSIYTMASDQSSKAPLSGKVDHYGGFIVDSKTLPKTVEQFTSDLKGFWC